jgi:hypothetical protein
MRERTQTKKKKKGSMSNLRTKALRIATPNHRCALLTLLLGLTAGLAAWQSVSAGEGHTTSKMRWDLIHFSATPVVTADAGGQASAKANDDSMITLTGSGTFLVRQGVALSDQATGGGTWQTSDPQGNLTGSGTYKVTSLVSWEEAPGSLSVVPGAIDNIANIADTHAGLLLLRIQYSDGSNGTLLVSCDLPGAPASLFEGVTPTKGFLSYWNRVAPAGADNRTLFHVLPDDSGESEHGHLAFGQGTSFIDPGVLTTFQFDETEVICSVGQAIMPDGTVMQMFMISEHVDSVTIDSAAKTATITGSMTSLTRLHSPNGTNTQLWEIVPFKAYAKDKGKDFFSLTVNFTDTAGLDQFDLFGSPATFAGTLVTGSITVK